MTRDTLRGFLIIIGSLSLLFIVILWYFGYSWYRSNRMAISLMPDRQRNVLYLGMGAVTVAAALYSLAQFQLIDLGAFSVPVLAAFFGGLFAMYYAWNESKRYYL